MRNNKYSAASSHNHASSLGQLQKQMRKPKKAVGARGSQWGVPPSKEKKLSKRCSLPLDARHAGSEHGRCFMLTCTCPCHTKILRSSRN